MIKRLIVNTLPVTQVISRFMSIKPINNLETNVDKQLEKEHDLYSFDYWYMKQQKKLEDKQLEKEHEFFKNDPYSFDYWYMKQQKNRRKLELLDIEYEQFKYDPAFNYCYHKEHNKEFEKVELSKEEYVKFKELMEENEKNKQVVSEEKNYRFSSQYWITAGLGGTSNLVLYILTGIPYSNHEIVPVITAITSLGFLGSFYPKLQVQSWAIGGPLVAIMAGSWVSVFSG
jgi:hypothetical protein